VEEVPSLKVIVLSAGYSLKPDDFADGGFDGNAGRLVCILLSPVGSWVESIMNTSFIRLDFFDNLIRYINTSVTYVLTSP
jgi:hypothetical protein